MSIKLHLRASVTAARQALAEAEIALAIAVAADPDPVPAPPAPEPAPPAPDPSPPPAPQPQVLPSITSINAATAVCFADYFQGGQAYERTQRPIILRGPATLRFVGIDWTRAGAYRPLQATEYGLLVDGAEVTTATVPAGATSGAFTLASLSEGWHRLDIRCAAGESPVPMFVYRAGSAQPDTMPVLLSSYGIYHDAYKSYANAMVPARFAPTVVPFVQRETPAFSEPLTRKSLIQRDLVPWRTYDLHRPRLTDGVLHTSNEQSYFWSSSAVRRYPELPLLDGPRGHGTISMTMHLQVGRNGGAYACDPWRLAHIQPDGTIRTLAGWRHPSPAPRPWPLPTDPKQRDAILRASLELVGDWSAIPPDRHGFHELWGMAWDQRTVQRGTGPAIPNSPNGDEPPHDVNPVCFLADSQHGRICRLEFDAKSHATPAKVTEFIAGLADPWDVLCIDGLLYVSERKANRIAVYSADTGAFVRTLVQGASGLARVEDATRFIRRLAPLDQIRAEPCVLPEGLYHLDGWVYFGSCAMGQVRRVKIATGELQTAVADITYSYGFSHYVKIAVSDGTFGPMGTVFAVNWLVANQGRPRAWLPDGTEWRWAPSWESGPGRPWETLGYGSAVAIGNGRLLCGTSSEGITMHSKALPGDAVISNAAWDTQRKAYEGAMLQLTHGQGGFGFYGLPLPWGVSGDIDAYLKGYGHQR
jgi:hypothetical protein